MDERDWKLVRDTTRSLGILFAKYTLNMKIIPHWTFFIHSQNLYDHIPRQFFLALMSAVTYVQNQAT